MNGEKVGICWNMDAAINALYVVSQSLCHCHNNNIMLYVVGAMDID